MTRIKYTSDYEHISTEWLSVGPNLILQASISLEDLTWSIDTQDYNTISTGQSLTLRSAKSQVRKKLIELGLNLDDEIRRTTPKSGTIN